MQKLVSISEEKVIGQQINEITHLSINCNFSNYENTVLSISLLHNIANNQIFARYEMKLKELKVKRYFRSNCNLDFYLEMQDS